MYPYFDGELLTSLTAGLISWIPSGIFGIVSYVFSSLALYTIAQRRGLNHPWLAWIPVVNCWIVGSLSDQYQYVVRGQNKSKRKGLLILGIVEFAVAVAVFVLVASLVVNAFFGAMGSMRDSELLEMVMGPAIGMMGLCVVLLAVSIAFAVIRYMALYDVYKSLDPGNCVMFLVLSIVFGITEPFFLFFNRNKDLGMPPLRSQAAYEQAQYQTRQEPRDYL